MQKAEFRNALCVLRSLDAHELRGVAPDTAQAFVRDPINVFLRAAPATADAIWQAVEARCPQVPA